MRAVRMFELSPLVTAASALALGAPAASRASRSNPDPMTLMPGHSGGSRRNALEFLSMIATLWPSSARRTAMPDPTRPHPTTTKCIGHHATRRATDRATQAPDAAAQNPGTLSLRCAEMCLT